MEKRRKQQLYKQIHRNSAEIFYSAILISKNLTYNYKFHTPLSLPLEYSPSPSTVQTYNQWTVDIAVE